MTNWETITKPKTQGGLGIKKFGPMKKALITKQYWRIRNNRNLLLSKTLKSKYCPNGELHSYKPNQKASWRNLICQHNPKLCRGSQRVGRGYNIPISHPAWFKFTPIAPTHIQNQIKTVANLIDQQNARWKTNLINQLYDKIDSDKILSIPLLVVETNAILDKLIWRHSLNGDQQVKKAYEILTQTTNDSRPPTNITPPPPLFGNNYGKSNFLRKSSPPVLETTMENQTSSENPHLCMENIALCPPCQSRAQQKRSTLCYGLLIVQQCH